VCEGVEGVFKGDTAPPETQKFEEKKPFFPG
jgi:hypothetical protein